MICLNIFSGKETLNLIFLFIKLSTKFKFIGLKKNFNDFKYKFYDKFTNI
jgi:hypothetical protein